MGIRTTSYGLAILSLITACSNTRLSMGRDAAVASTLPSDALVVLPDAAIPKTDTGLLSADPDTAPSGPDSATKVPDAATARADTAPAMPDTATVVPDTATVVPDTATVVPDTATAPVDTAQTASDGFTIDSPTIAPNPYANRTFYIVPAHPAPTPDATCTQYGPVDYYEFRFGSDITTVAVFMVSGSFAKLYHAAMGPEASKLTYHFTNFPTGGTITFERDQGVQVAQVIMRGSGVLVYRCLRGTMIRGSMIQQP